MWLKLVCMSISYYYSCTFQWMLTHLGAIFVSFHCVKILFCEIFQVVALTVVSFGVAVATVADLQFSLFGACVALAWILPSAINKILWSNMQQRENWTALAYVTYHSKILIVY